jgi:hypothetical protein
MVSGMRLGSATLLSLVVLGGAPRTLAAQPGVVLTSDVLLYGDNTEFRNPFREGATIFGAAARAGAEIELSPAAALRLGAIGNLRFGSEDAFEIVRPVVALDVRRGASIFTIGTLPPPDALGVAGPDLVGPHGLLPSIQRETLAFDRPHEAGLMWRLDTRRLRHEMWVNWQRLNTPAHRERFDAGAAGSIRLSGALAVPVHVHVVHEGGQLHASGPVADSVALATGVSITPTLAQATRVSIEVLGAASRDVPDRERPEASRSGAALFVRVAVSRGLWRGHLIVWRGDDFIKVEGDPNYQSMRRDGSRYRGVRDYAEAGIARSFRPAPGVRLEASARAHRTERFYEYSYRVLAVVAVRARVR